MVETVFGNKNQLINIFTTKNYGIFCAAEVFWWFPNPFLGVCVNQAEAGLGCSGSGQQQCCFIPVVPPFLLFCKCCEINEVCETSIILPDVKCKPCAGDGKRCCDTDMKYCKCCDGICKPDATSICQAKPCESGKFRCCDNDNCLCCDSSTDECSTGTCVAKTCDLGEFPCCNNGKCQCCDALAGHCTAGTCQLRS